MFDAFNPVDIRMIGLVVITIKGFFFQIVSAALSLDCERVVVIGGSCSKVPVNVVHG